MRRQLIDGLYVFNKSVGVSSAGFLNHIKKRFEVSKIGHGGTLDPFASGVLVVGVGREYTKQLLTILKKTTKEYEASIVLGASSSTDDATGEIEQRVCVAPPSRAAIQQACEQLQERTEQMPPRFSAVKVGGVPAYAHARRGNTVVLEAKETTLYSFFIHNIRTKSDGTTLVDITLVVSSGFYVRSFARDLGELLGVGGYAEALTRTRVGDFYLDHALGLEDVDGVVEARISWKGRVQGIGFRDFVRITAERYHLVGWVRNVPDGSVECVAQGTMERLDGFLKSIATEHAYARIEKTDLLFQKPLETFENFLVADFQTMA